MKRRKAGKKIKGLKLRSYNNSTIAAHVRNITACFIFFLITKNSCAQQIIWADSVLSFSSQKSEKLFSAQQALGVPNNYPNTGFSTTAWMPSIQAGLSSEFLIVQFERTILPKQILIVENYFPGNIKKIVLTDITGRNFPVYTNPSPSGDHAEGSLFTLNLPAFAKPVISAQIEFQKFTTENLFQIDAIGLTASEEVPDLSVPVPPFTDNIKPEQLPVTVNSDYDEVSPVISPDGKTLYFDRKKHPDNLGPDKNDDIWFSSVNETGTFSSAVNMGEPLNNERSNFICSVSPDGNTVMLGNIFLPDGSIQPGISLVNRTDSGWTSPVPQNINEFYNSEKFNEYSLSADGNTLMLTAGMNDSYGMRDVYVSFYEGNNTWSKPLNLGANINTAGEEISPFLAADNTTLYYSTTGKAGYGLADIYMSKRLDNTWTKWSEPVNLGTSVNTADWDAYYTIDAKGEYAYFCSNRDAKDNVDIYRMKLPASIRPDKVISVSGIVTDRSTGKMISASIFYSTAGQRSSSVSNTINSSGYLFYVQPDDSIYISVEAEGYYLATAQAYSNGPDLTYDFELIPKRTGAIIEMHDILFNANSSVLKDSSYAELDKIKRFLTENPATTIEVRGHTNGLCEDNFCLSLSEKRAKTVAGYFIAGGISEKRISYKGYGKQLPIADNDTPQGRKENQRVEFMITGTE